MISKVNCSNCSFGRVWQSAKTQAIIDADDDYRKLKKVNDCIKSQENNKDYHIAYVGIRGPLGITAEGYGVINSKDFSLINYFPTLESACKHAHKRIFGRVVAKNNEYEIFDNI